ncbi:ATPase RavA [Symmachiella dynata]|uniref:AAA family ATPase n=1 Tax=Symmachiella dynata TaxID=2527995 RepID=UPI00118BDC3B|nr:MoxR family ATPase [Symmachiella dynata]QDT47238.1 ATPase RavA [Symmachiella dynata]
MADSLPELTGDDQELLSQAHQTALRLREELAKVIVGQEATVNTVLAAVFSQGHTLIIGVPGLAKTLLVRTLAKVLGWKFKRVQFTPDMMPADIIGMELLQQDSQTGDRKMQFVPGPLFAQMVLADEINRTPPKTQSALLEAMQEFTVTSMGQTHHLPRPFLVFATQNPIEQEGTYPLPEAQLDRFMFSLWMDYPDADEEVEIVLATTEDSESEVKAVCTAEEIQAFQHLVRRIPVSRHVVRYAVMLARATRPEGDLTFDFVTDYVSWGAGPRASQHMILAAKALAVVNGEPAVSTEHVRKVAPLVLRHRILPNYSATGEGIDARAIVTRIIEEVSEPVATYR